MPDAQILGAAAESLGFGPAMSYAYPVYRIEAAGSLRWACGRMAVTDDTTAAGRTVRLVLNRQQLELVDRTVARGLAKDRAALVHLALAEYAALAAAGRLPR